MSLASLKATAGKVYAKVATRKVATHSLAVILTLAASAAVKYIQERHSATPTKAAVSAFIASRDISFIDDQGQQHAIPRGSELWFPLNICVASLPDGEAWLIANADASIREQDGKALPQIAIDLPPGPPHTKQIMLPAQPSADNLKPLPPSVPGAPPPPDVSQ